MSATRQQSLFSFYSKGKSAKNAGNTIDPTPESYAQMQKRLGRMPRNATKEDDSCALDEYLERKTAAKDNAQCLFLPDLQSPVSVMQSLSAVKQPTVVRDDILSMEQNFKFAAKCGRNDFFPGEKLDETRLDSGEYPLSGQSLKRHLDYEESAEGLSGVRNVQDSAVRHLVPGIKRIQEDTYQPNSDPNKRRKMLEFLGIDQDLQKGSWANAQSKFEWLQPSKIRDRMKRKPGDPLYDNRTIYIPPDIFKKFSASQKQYWDIKQQYMDTILFFKVGKFYELYELDAEIGHKELDWKITISGVGKCRQVGVPESGIDDAVQKLVARGYKVGRVEQIETAEHARAKRGSGAMVERRLVQVQTPSTLTDGIIRPEAVHLLAVKEVAICSDTENTKIVCAYGFAFVDAAAGRFFIGTLHDDCSRSSLKALLMQVSPQEVLYELGGMSKETRRTLQSISQPGLLPVMLTPLQPESEFTEPCTALKLLHASGFFQADFTKYDNWSSKDIIWPDAFHSLVDKHLAATALGALVSHLRRIKAEGELSSSILCPYEVFQGSLRLDGPTIANLELLQNSSDGKKTGTLLAYLDSCITPFGKRLLRKWICHPLRDIREINNRLDAVDELLESPELSCTIRVHMKKIIDIERVLARLRAFGSCTTVHVLPAASKKMFQRRLKTLCEAVNNMQKANEVLIQLNGGEPKSYLLQTASTLANMAEAMDCLSEIQSHVDTNNQLLRALQCKENDEDDTGTTVLSSCISLFNQYSTHWMAIVDALSYLDIFLAFAASTANGPSCRPQFVASRNVGFNNVGPILQIEGLWHPFAVGAAGGTLVPNDVNLGTMSLPARAMLLTGPNMGGKSTLLRATCIAVIMAQLGCYVPGTSCTLTPVDIIFTRIGASDRIMSGESTFMVECSEASSILQYATCNSLVVLDELGRGTSTFDGYAIAYAVFQHLVETIGCRMLFATHYHPLTEEFNSNPAVSLQHMACSFASNCYPSCGNDLNKDEAAGVDSREKKELVFLYKLRPGPSPQSYGLQVALLAGISESIVVSAARAGQTIHSRLQGFKHRTPCLTDVQKQCVDSILGACKAGTSNDPYGVEDAYDTVLCIWHELQKSKL